MANILLVEDDRLVSDTLSAAIKSKGHTLVTAENGIEGLRQFAKAKFDLVITDIIMPDMEGIGMIMELRKKDPHVQILAISGGGRTGNVEFLNMAEKLDASATLKKPIHLNDFFDTLSKCLKPESAKRAS